VRPRSTGRPSKQAPAAAEKLNGVEQALDQRPTSPATIRIEVDRLLTKLLR
jgi:hypothetical protein